MNIDRATPATQNGHDNSIRHRPSHDSNLQQAQTFSLLKYWYIFLSCNKAHFGWDMNGISAVQPQQRANPYGVLVREKYSGPFFLLWTEQSIWPSYTNFTNLHFPEIRQFGEASSPSPSSHRRPPILLLQSNGWHRYGSVCVLPGQSLIEVNASQNRTQ